MKLLIDLIKNFISMFDSEKMGDMIIKKQQEIYFAYKNKYPGEEPHFWLANTYLSRRKTHGDNTNDPLLQQVSYTETFLAACLSEPNNAKSLGLYILYKERPDIVLKYHKYDKEYSNLMSGLLELKKKSPEKLITEYKKYNPRLAKKG